MADDRYWAGSTWIYASEITNGGSAGAPVWEISPGAGNEFEVLYGRLVNLDPAGQQAFCAIGWSTGVFTTSGIAIAQLVPILFTVSPGASIHFPMVQLIVNSNATGPTRFIVSGSMVLEARFNTLSANEDAIFSLCARIRGGRPTVNTSFSSGGNEDILVDQVF